MKDGWNLWSMASRYGTNKHRLLLTTTKLQGGRGRERESKHTTISAMTLGWRSGLRRKARVRLRTRTRVIWTTRRGKAKCKGSSPCHAPFEEVLMEVMFIAMDQIICSTRWGTNKDGVSKDLIMEFSGPLVCRGKMDFLEIKWVSWDFLVLLFAGKNGFH